MASAKFIITPVCINISHPLSIVTDRLKKELL
ncbi:unnamed protein product, partial [marine sediment metagenome]